MMILRLISVPELNFTESWTNGIKKLNELSPFDKYMTLFWFLGPLIYLIERSPADIWLSLIGIIFLARCFLKNDWQWTSQLWFKFAFALWIFGLFSAITSPNPYFTFQQGFVWIRFPLYAAAAQVWLAKDRDIRIVMLLSILLGMLIMCIILISEVIIEPKTRLSWPYGDLVPGGYIAKFSLPLFCVLIAIAVNQKNTSGITSGLIALLSLFVSALTGERGNFIIRACGGMLAGLVWKPKFYLYTLLILIEISALVLIMVSRPDLGNRFGKEFVKHLPIPIQDLKFFDDESSRSNFTSSSVDNNPYWGAWRGGIQQGFITPIKGIGPSGTRNTCKDLDNNLPKWLPGKNYCGNHPHNFYIQLFAETGIIGLIVGISMFTSIIYSCYKARKYSPNCPMSSTAFVIPLAFFFPIQQFGSFYGQWGNLFTWFAIGFALSQFQNWRPSNKTFEK